MSRRASMLPPDGGPTPLLTAPHRRMSRMDPGHLAPGRRMSLAPFRRQSVAASLHSTERSHLSGPARKLQPTYRLAPEEGDRFSAARVEKTLPGIMEAFLMDERYDSAKVPKLSKQLTEVIMSRVKEMHFPRYKIVTHVVIGQNRGQGVEAASRCMWDGATDSFATASYKNSELFAVATVFGSYFE